MPFVFPELKRSKTLGSSNEIDLSLKCGSIFSTDLTALFITVKVLKPRKSNFTRPTSSTSYISSCVAIELVSESKCNGVNS
jgi:hypothetical protein